MEEVVQIPAAAVAPALQAAPPSALAKFAKDSFAGTAGELGHGRVCEGPASP